MIPISICIITKNEENYLENCLKAIRNSLKVPIGCTPIPHEIVVTDTGSTDNTRNIALQYADKVADFVWIQDFSAARNFCTSKASHDYILCIDSDEYVEQADWYAIDEMISKHPTFSATIDHRNLQEDTSGNTIVHHASHRFFNRNYYHFERRIHEQIMPLPSFFDEVSHGRSVDEFLMQDILHLPFSVLHVGYVGDEEYLRKKSERDLILLLEDLNEDPASPYNLFQVGQCYHMMDDDARAIEFYEKAFLFDLNPKMDYVKVLVTTYGYCLLHLERYEEAMGLEAIYNDYDTTADFVILMGLIYAHNKLYIKALAEFVKALSFTDENSFNIAANKQTAHYNIGYIYEVFGEKEMAITQYKMCGDYQMALARLQELQPENA